MLTQDVGSRRGEKFNLLLAIDLFDNVTYQGKELWLTGELEADM